MLAFIFAPFFIAFEVFLFIRTLKYLRRFNTPFKTVIPAVFAALLISGVVTTLVGFFVSNDNPFKRILTRFGYTWFGFFLYFAIALTAVTVVLFVIRKIKKESIRNDHFVQYSIVFIILFTISMGFYGSIHAHKLKVNHYDIEVEKSAEVNKLDVVLLTDLHIGYNTGVKEIEDMVNKVNDLNPDIIIIAGDIFDNQYEAIEDPQKIAELLSFMKSKYGTYAVFGNHDIEEKILMGFTFNNGKDVKISEEMLELLSDSNITLLYDDYVEIEGIQIYGRPDRHKYNLGNTVRKTPEEIIACLNQEKPIIVIDHEPKELHELASVGVDIDLCGHTHDGQLWPLNHINECIWENPAGYLDIDGMANIVSAGVGLFGVNMRTFTDAEICDITITFRQ